MATKEAGRSRRRSVELLGSSPPVDSQALFHDLTLFNLEGHIEPA